MDIDQLAGIAHAYPELGLFAANGAWTLTTLGLPLTVMHFVAFGAE